MSTKPVISLKQCMIGQSFYDRRTHAFDWYQSQQPWMTLNGQNVTLAEITNFYRTHQKNLYEDRPILWVAKCRPM